MYRGSRKHVLDWVQQPRFLPELLGLAAPIECRVTSDSIWQPMSHSRPDEARLERFGPMAIPGVEWEQLQDWWLVHRRGANTPNWDVALACEIEGKPGLILVEAKANVTELSDGGKRLDDEPSPHTEDNHKKIAAAIESARADLAPQFPGISIGVDRSYQLSNRIAFAWKLAQLGVPTALIYLGFLGDTNLDSALGSESEWELLFKRHVDEVGALPLLEKPIDVGQARFWVLCRSKRILEPSPARSSSSATAPLRT